MNSSPYHSSHVSVADYMRNESRFRVVERTNPDRFKAFLHDAQEAAQQRYAVYQQLADIPHPVEIVLLFRPAEEAPEFARQAVAIGAKALWLQLGLGSEAAERIARAGGLRYVEDTCSAVVRSLARIRKPAA